MTGGETGWQGSFIRAATTPSSPETTVSHCHPTTSTWCCEEGGEGERGEGEGGEGEGGEGGEGEGGEGEGGEGGGGEEGGGEGKE